MTGFACYEDADDTIGVYPERKYAEPYRHHGPIAEFDATGLLAWIPRDGAPFPRANPNHEILADIIHKAGEGGAA